MHYKINLNKKAKPNKNLKSKKNQKKIILKIY